LNRHPRFVSHIAQSGFTTASQPDGDKSPRHRVKLTYPLLLFA
jgi:hypothetical protein